jgi:hypothetical protein
MTIKTRFTFIDLDNETHGEKRVVLGWRSTPENEALARELFIADEVVIEIPDLIESGATESAT